MFRWITIVILAISLTGTAVWGYKEHEDKNAILIQAENSYQRSFHELSYNMNLLHDKLGATLAMNTKESLSPQLIDIWRLTSESQSNVGQLPLTLLPFNKTEEFLSEIGDFSYRTAVRDLEKEPLSQKEEDALKELYTQSQDIKDELRTVQRDILGSDLRWMDVQLALATNEEQQDNTVIDGLKTVEKKVEGYGEGNEDSSLLGTPQKVEHYEHIKGKKINKNEAIDKAQSLINLNKKEKMDVSKSGEGSNLPLYTVSYDNNNYSAHIDMSQNGGSPITMLINRPMGEQSVSLNKGLQKAKTYLKDLGFQHMKAYRSNQYDSVGVYSFLYQEDDIRIYPDTIEVKVGLDKGDILGLTAQNYYMNHKNRKLPKPAISLEEAKTKVNQDVKIQEKYLALIQNDLNEEVLTYEFLATLGPVTYQIFINATNGKEERIEKIDHTEINLTKAF